MARQPEFPGPGEDGQSLPPAIRRRLKELDAINRIGAAAGEALEVEALCTLTGSCLLELFGTGIVFVALYDIERGLISTPFFAMAGETRSYPPFPLGQGLSSMVLSSRKLLYLASAAEIEALKDRMVLRATRPPKSWLGVPILAGVEILGLLSVQSFDEEEAFSPEDIGLLSTIASTLGSRILGIRLFEAVNRRALEAAAVAEAGRWISESLELDTVLGRMAERAASLLTRGTAAVFLREGEALRAVAAVGSYAEAVRAENLALGRGIISRIVRTGIAEIVDNTAGDPDSVPLGGHLPDSPGERLLAAPLFQGTEVRGVMVVWRDPEEDVFRRADLDFLSSLARQAEVAIHNATLHREVVEEARRSGQLYELARRARAEAEEANRLKSRFLATMSHELRTPLNAVINFAWLLQAGTEGALNESQADFVGRIEEAGTDLLGLINDILDLSKIESGLMELRIQKLDVADLARGVLATTAGLLRGKPVDLVADMGPGLPPLRADLARVRQLLLNLLSNAAKFTEVGRITLRVRLEAGGEDMLFEVEDSGIGMAGEDIPRAFSEFVQLEAATAMSVRGTGLGLPLARKFVELHGGRIWASSVLGEGSVFSFTLPLAGPVTADGASCVEPPGPGGR